MFWGLIMEPQKRYTQTVKKPFRITMASLDLLISSDEHSQVMCCYDGRNYLLCTLRKPDLLQCPLDLTFEVGTQLAFAANGNSHVHLTGYLLEGRDYIDPSDEEIEEEEEFEVSEDEDAGNKKKRAKKAQKNGPPTKKSKTTAKNKSTGDSDSDDTCNSSDFRHLLDKSLSDTDDDSSFKSDDEEADEETEDDEEDVDEEDVEDEDEEEESSLSEAESEEIKPTPSPKKKNKQSNGVVKPDPAPLTKKEKAQQKQDQKKSGKTQAQVPKKKFLSGGVIIEDLIEGEGVAAKTGKMVSVHYEGRLKQNNKLFDKSVKNSPFTFRLGSGEVIKGWDVGLVGMKPGSKRRITCPPAMAYGQKGSPPTIPANSTLVFEVELKKVR